MTFKTKSLSFCASIALIAISSQTVSAQNSAQNLLECRSIVEESKRLSCYDNIADQMSSLLYGSDAKSSNSSETNPSLSPSSAQPTQADKPDVEKKGLFRRITGLVGLNDDDAEEIQRVEAESYGKAGIEDFGNVKDKDLDADEVIMTIGKVQMFQMIKRRFYMTNGQVWEQKTGVNVDIEPGMQSPGVEAYIEDSGFSGYTMKINGEGNKIKVKRVL